MVGQPNRVLAQSHFDLLPNPDLPIFHLYCETVSMEAYKNALYMTVCFISSINHNYDGQWSATARLTTCDPHAKRTVMSSDPPQEVGDKKEIIFT